MSSFVSWVDFSTADRERMRRAIALFQEKESRDELGLGTIRDAFADALFPGTSTIQTRLRYVLFVPWVYLELESSRTGAESVAKRARAMELELGRVLAASSDSAGAIGRRAGSDLQRLPSSVYWGALQTWEICGFRGSREQYHRAFDKLRRQRRAGLVPDDEGIESESRHVWHPKIPSPPEGWPDEVDFTLSTEEAEFIKGRIGLTCRGTLLNWLAQHGKASKVDAIWKYPQLAELPEAIDKQVDLARRFSALMYGAALLYNLMLSERYPHEDKRDEWVQWYREALDEWAAGAAPLSAGPHERDELQSFSLSELWRFVDDQEARVPLRTRDFVERWAMMLHETDPARVADHPEARRMVEDRERALKKARSRFLNRRALDAWGGASGTWRFTYRWRVAQSHLRDLRGAKD